MTEPLNPFKQSQLKPEARTVKLWQKLAALVRTTLAEFWLQALPKDNGLLTLLETEAKQLLQVDNLPTTQELFLTLQEQLQQPHAPKQPQCLAAFIADQQLSLSDALLLTLLGETERSHLVTLTVNQLQAPSQAVFPTVHLIEAWQQTLPGNTHFSSMLWLHHPLIENGIITWHGDGPQPLKQMRISAAFWGLMTDQLKQWPNTAPLSTGDNALLPTALLTQLPVVTKLLRNGAAAGLVLRGFPSSGRKLFTAALAEHLGLTAMSIPESQWANEPELRACAHYCQWLAVITPTTAPGELKHIPLSPAPMVVHLGTDGAVELPGFIELVMPLPNVQQRQQLWAAFLNDNSNLSHLAANALLSGPSIQLLAETARLMAEREQQPLSHAHIVQARLQMGAEKLRLLAQPDTRFVSRDAIVLPPLVEAEIDRLVGRALQRETLWENLGSTLQKTHTPGVRALFVGESGTGKTLSANFIATQMGAPLYRVDLSAVMNKYIGESEKNLSIVLDMAAAGDVVLLFDEADSLFGKRTEGKETGERFANMLTHFLLTRIENHPGIILLTSNNRERIDEAFTRRLDLIIEFPLPGFEERQQLWQSHLGRRGPGLEVNRLLASYCDFSGGQLRNVVLAAACHAGNAAITPSDLLVGLNAEYRKLGRALPTKLKQLMHMKTSAKTSQNITENQN